MNEIDQFNFAEYVSGDIRNRGHIIDLTKTKVVNNSEKEAYLGMFQHSEELKFYVEKTGSVKGFRGEHVCRQILIDFDRTETSLEQVEEEVWKFCNHLIAKYDIPAEYLRISFSGSKGFHVSIPLKVFTENPKPRIDFYDLIKSIVKELTDGFKYVDNGIYNPLRIIGIINTINRNTNLYRIPLTLSELKLSIDEIKTLAKQPRVIEQWH